MLQAPVFDGLALDPLPLLGRLFGRDRRSIGGREVAQALVIAAVNVVRDEGLDLGLEIAGQIVVL